MEIKAPGLKWIKRRASYTPIWVAVSKGYYPRTVNLARFRDDPDRLRAECASLQARLNLWRSTKTTETGFDGTLQTLLRRYQSDPGSSYHGLRSSSRKPYDHYIARLAYEVGDRRVDAITGMDLVRWHRVWSQDGERLAASKMMRAVLDSAISYGIMSRLPGCVELRAVLKAASRRLPAPKPRQVVVSSAAVGRLRGAAHANGRPSSALAYALVFETTLRLWDVIGQWRDNSGADVEQWFGIRWEDVGQDMVLRYMPSKTSAKTGLCVTFPLDKAPMVMEELVHWPTESRVGPIIVSERTGVPYSSNRFGEYWRMDADAAGLPKNIWARDLRASGITEARAAGISTDDAAKVAGHSSTKTTAKVYDRANLEAAGRFAEARANKRLVDAGKAQEPSE